MNEINSLDNLRASPFWDPLRNLRLDELLQSPLWEQVKAPIFVVGCGHSGTTLVNSLLGLHKNIYAIPFETSMFLAEPQRIERAVDMLAPVDQRTLLNWHRRYVLNNDKHIVKVCHVADMTAVATSAIRWSEKTPRHILRIPIILESMPDARIIIVTRDGRDVATSLALRQSGTFEAFKSGVERWVHDNKAGEPYWKHCNVIRIRFEDIITNFESSMREICDFLTEEYDPNMTAYNRNDTDEYKSHVQVSGEAGWVNYRTWLSKQPLHDTRGKWIAYMGQEEKTYFKDYAGEALIEYGYVDNLDW